MGAVSAPGGKTSGKKQLNADLNLVPFIDLLTCLICFLLMTAVWVQIGSISIRQSGQGLPTPLDEEQRNNINLVLTITPQGFILTGNGAPIADILKAGNQYDFAKLGQELATFHQANQDKTDIVVISEDTIKYQEVINTMDVCLVNNFPNISVSGTI